MLPTVSFRRDVMQSDKDNRFGSLPTENILLWDGASSKQQGKFQLPLTLARGAVGDVNTYYPRVLQMIKHKSHLLGDYPVFKSTIKIQVRLPRDATNINKYPLKWIMESFSSTVTSMNERKKITWWPLEFQSFSVLDELPHRFLLIW